jgi:hypothetical protein
LGDNEKGTCMLLDVTILRKNVIPEISVKWIKFYSINREKSCTEQQKLCCAFAEWNIWSDAGGDITLQRNYEWSTATSTYLTLQEVHLVRCLTYISHRFIAPGRSLVSLSQANYRDVQQELIAGNHRTAIWLVVVTVDVNIWKPITQTLQIEMAVTLY